MNHQKQTDWTLILKPKTGWFDIDYKSLWYYRHLILLFVRRNFVSLYKQTILGPLWFFIQPILTTLIYTVVFSNIAKISTDGLPPMLFYMSGTIIWNYFGESLRKISNMFIENASIFGKVYFPRLVIPISIGITNLLTFGLQLIFFLIFMGYYKLQGFSFHLNYVALLLPVLILILAFYVVGLGIIISSLTTKYRDLRFLVNFGIQLYMYASPVVYPLSTVPDKYKFIFILNPITPIIETFRHGFLGSGEFAISYLITSITVIICITIIGLVLFSRVEKTFMDTV